MKKVVIVEDDIDLLETLGIILQDEGHRVWKFSKGKVATNKIKKLSPDTVVIDLMLPDLNGEEIAKKIKTDNNFKNTKVILISAGERVAKSAHVVGADAYLRKPFSVDTLLSLI